MKRVLLLSLWMSLTVAHAGSNFSAPMDRILSAQASHSAADIVKIAGELADEILTGRGSPWRVTAAVVGLYRKAEALEAESITAEDAGRLGRLYLLLSESYADEAKRYLERSVQESGRLEERTALGNALLYLGDAAGARRQYLAVSERRPHDPVIQVNLAMAERALGDTASAYSRLRHVMTQTSDRAVERTAMLAIADIQLASRDLTGSKLHVSKILQKWPEDVEALGILKQIYEKEGRADLAKGVEIRLAARKGTANKGEK